MRFNSEIKGLVRVAGTIGMSVCVLLSSAFAGDRLLFKAETLQTSDYDAPPIKSTGKKNEPARYFVVQFKSKIRHQDRLNVTSLGGQIARYIPEDALVVKATPRVAMTIAKSSGDVRLVIPFEAKWKVSDDFEPANVFTAGRESHALIRLFPTESDTNAQSRIESINGVEVESASGRSIVVRMKRSALDEVSALEGVEWVQPVPEFQSLHMSGEDFNNTARMSTGDYRDLTGFESGTKLMNFEGAWQRGFAGRGQIVAMADTGLDRGDLTNVLPDFAGRVTAGLIFGLFSKSWEDPMGHGTHVGGSAVGGGQSSGGALKGGAYDSGFVAGSMWSPMLGNLSVPSKLRDLFAKSYEQGARIHTNSWGSPQNLGVYDAFAQQVDEFAATNPDMLVLFAAGNSGVDADKDGRIDGGSVSTPGTAKNVLTVGASKNLVMSGGIQKKLKELRMGQEAWSTEPLASSMLSENPQGLAPFSSRGPTRDGRLKPEIVAPGTNVLSARSQHPKAQPLWGIYNQEYVWSGGTSMATPLVAGAAAVVRQYLVEDRKIASPSASLIKAILMHTAVDLFPGQFGEKGKSAGQELLTRRPNMDQGYGRVDVTKATDLPGAMLVDERTGLGMGETHKYPVDVSRKATLTATLVYTDAAAASGAAKALVNDLDLTIVDGAGKEITLGDRVNNSEMIEGPVEAGAYEVRVRGFNVPAGPKAGKQPYALVLSVK